MEDRPYQEEAAEWLSRRRVGAIVAAAGSGKTHMMAMALAKVLERRGGMANVGVMCNTREQVEQWQAAFDRFPIIADRAVVTIRCAAAQPDWSAMDVLITDELHHLRSAPTWQAAFATCHGAKWGCTATPWGEDEDENALLRSMFHNQFHIVDRQAVGDRLTTATVVMHHGTDADIVAEIDAEIDAEVRRRARWWKGLQGELWGQVAWQACCRRGIVGNQARNNEAIRLARQHSGESVLMLVGQIEHGDGLCVQIPGAELCHSKLPVKQRRRIIEGFRSGEVPCMVATSLADEGFDAPIASVLILVSGGRNESRTIQRAGRVCRKHEGKVQATIHDWLDDWHALAAKHSKRRVETYRSLGYRIEQPTNQP